MTRPPSRRTFAARTVTRLALLLLVVGVLLAALLGHLTKRDDSRPAPSSPAPAVQVTGPSSAHKSSPTA